MKISIDPPKDAPLIPRVKTMCLNEECTKKFECLRYAAYPHEIKQEYGYFKPNTAGYCSEFTKIRIYQIVKYEKGK